MLTAKPFVIVVEGLDGSGKTSLISLLRQALDSQGVDSFFGDWFRNKDVQRLAMLFNTLDRMTPEILAAMHGVSTLFQVKEAYDSGCEVVIWDRYIYSSFASCTNRGASRELMSSIVAEVPEPNLIVLLVEDPLVCYERVVQRKGLRFFESNIDRLYRGRISEALEAFKEGRIPQPLLREVFVNAGHEWYEEIDSILNGKNVHRVYKFDLAQAVPLVQHVISACVSSIEARANCSK